MIPLELIDLISRKINVQLLISIFPENNCIYFFNKKWIEKYILKKHVENLFINRTEICKVIYKSETIQNPIVIYTSEKMFEKIDQYFQGKTSIYYHRSYFETIEVTYDPMYDMINNNFDAEKEKKMLSYILSLSDNVSSGDTENYIFFTSGISFFANISLLLDLGNHPRADWINNPINKIVNEHLTVKNNIQKYIQK
jgi:hypothetical protein